MTTFYVIYFAGVVVALLLYILSLRFSIKAGFKHYSRAYKHSHKYYAKCQKRYDGFFSIIKEPLDPHIFLQHPKVVYVIDKKDLVNPNGLFSIKDYLEKQEI